MSGHRLITNESGVHRPGPAGTGWDGPRFLQSAILALLLVMVSSHVCLSQQTPPAAAPATPPSPQSAPINGSTSRPPSAPLKNAKQPTQSERRHASTLYLAGAKL